MASKIGDYSNGYPRVSPAIEAAMAALGVDRAKDFATLVGESESQLSRWRRGVHRAPPALLTLCRLIVLLRESGWESTRVVALIASAVTSAEKQGDAGAEVCVADEGKGGAQKVPSGVGSGADPV